jgi:cytochrome c553
MRKLSNLAMVCWGAVAVLAFSGASFAEEGAITANVTNGKNIFENGKGDAVPACATCHGDKAMGNDAMGSPRLANIGYAYIVKQLTNFAEDKRKDLTMDQMNGIAKIGESYKGQALVRYGDMGRVSACMSCHGFNGRGADPVYPKIGQQKYVYLVNQLTHWRDGSRANDPMGQMQKIAKNLSDEDIHNAAAFLSQAADSTAGNGMEIDNKTVLKNVKIVR